MNWPSNSAKRALQSRAGVGIAHAARSSDRKRQASIRIRAIRTALTATNVDASNRTCFVRQSDSIGDHGAAAPARADTRYPRTSSSRDGARRSPPAGNAKSVSDPLDPGNFATKPGALGVESVETEWLATAPEIGRSRSFALAQVRPIDRRPLRCR
jgi:hypothetical protein